MVDYRVWQRYEVNIADECAEVKLNTDQLSSEGERVLRKALRKELPVVAVLGQASGWSCNHPDPSLAAALAKASRDGGDWKSLLSMDPLPEGFYEWLSERFVHRAPSPELLAIADAPLSAVYTSSVDPGLLNLFTTSGREPIAVLLGDPPPQILRSRKRPPVYYLFGRAGAGLGDFKPPLANQALSQRRLHHATAMLRTVNETATALGLIVIDGYKPDRDWLRAEDLLAVLASAPLGGVLWCGQDPQFSGDDAKTYSALVELGVIVREHQPLGMLLTVLSTGDGDVTAHRWDDPEVISIVDDKRIITTPQLRLSTESSAAIIDDSWTGFLPPLSDEAEQSAFHAFHAVSSGPRGLIEGIRRDFSFTREFESFLRQRIDLAIGQHHKEAGAIILHGQSGVGKTIALGRLSLGVRKSRSAAVLFAYNRVPQADELADFLAEVDKVGGVTLLVIDATASIQRYDDILRAFRSRGHRVVLIGSSYKIEPQLQAKARRFVEAPAELTATEKPKLIELYQRFTSDERASITDEIPKPHALARFFWLLPSSRPRISEGLGQEARATELEIRTRGASKQYAREIGTLGAALINAGFPQPVSSLLDDLEDTGPGSNTAAGRMIDYVMAASRLYQWVPVNLILRGVLSCGLTTDSSISIEIVRNLFEGQDIFRWRFTDEEGQELVVGARLQFEAELVCNRRLGGPASEAAVLMDLVRCAVRAGAEENEETRFVADIIYALGPDGPFGHRYKDSYNEIARTLTELREQKGVQNARFMLQESTLRRHFVRTHNLDASLKTTLLDEARRAIDDALRALDQTTGYSLRASRRTRDNLWVERAATYGFLATDSAQKGGSVSEIWSSYRAARDAVHSATGRVDSYFPLDIGLWLPADILRDASGLSELQRLELEADIRSTLDLVEPENLDAKQFEIFQSKRYRVGGVLSDAQLADAAFSKLADTGSYAGYYLRARYLAPDRPEKEVNAKKGQREAARIAADYLWSVYNQISRDGRCLQLLLSCEWLSCTGRWLFRGQRQPLPFETEDRAQLRGILLDFISASSHQVPTKYRYLDAVLNWLITDEKAARRSFRDLGRDTDYVEHGRVTARHVVTDKNGEPRSFQGLVERQVGEKQWSVYVSEISRHVDLRVNDFSETDVAVGQTIRSFSIMFNYLGARVDRRKSSSLRS